MQEDNYKKFKCLLEYFVSHLEWVVNEDSNHPGYKNYIEPIQDFKKDGRGYDQNKHYKIQDQISPWCKYGSDVVYINCDARRIQSKSSYLNWNLTWINIRPNWQQMNGTSHVSSLYLTKEEGTNAPTELSMSLEELGLFDNSNPNHNLKVFFNQYNSFLQMYNSTYNNQKYLDLLKSNHNLILTGAPGTGKTYLAKQIAQQIIFGEIKEKMSDEELKQFNEQCGFVQFHPSYDYTDFVEGLRPVQDETGNVGFERKDGVFKEFCKKALKTLEACYSDLLRDISNSKKFTLKQKGGNDTTALSVDDEKRIRWIERNNPEKIASNYVSFDNLKILYEKYNTFEKLNNIENINEEIRKTIEGTADTTYYWTVLNELLHRMREKIFVFIIDEINRGEISKIFGELFFSIDPGYRGTDGKVRTQYANMQTTPNDFDKSLGITDSNNYGHFFVPENVYIIGTMNDIDRSVESMDFAFRRRFAFKEIKATDRVEMLDDLTWKDEAVKRMNRLNAKIEIIEGLSSAYHIGPAYFLKLKNYNGDFDQLWENHLEGLLREYLRGMQNLEEKLKTLKAAYDNESDSDSGQQQE